MNRRVRKANTPDAKKMWEAVSKAAECVPEWMKPNIETQASASAARILERWETLEELDE